MGAIIANKAEIFDMFIEFFVDKINRNIGHIMKKKVGIIIPITDLCG